MPIEVLQRFVWDRGPQELGDLFRLSKRGREARAALWTHQLGWEVRLLLGRSGEVTRTQVCRSQDEVLDTGEQWKAAMIAEGWQ